ncbi:MAG: glycoside hydrolase family 3 C-terminal domain-containing protein [Streptosporangiaceae bacterium]|nr:glycoside hydrolase family 3 C-terminal domain-containing protein [Streptosporangiaceae bacterium]
MSNWGLYLGRQRGGNGKRGRGRWRIAGAASAAGLAALIALPATGAVGGAAAAAATTSCPWVTSTAPIPQRVAQLIAAMSLADKISMVEGHGTSNPYVFYTPAIPSLCIPAVGLEDGPAGVADGLTGVTQLPAGVALAATWDPSLANRYGTVIGAEEFGKGASANLGPTVNIDRDPRWGRSFEALSEDPFLNASLDVPEINGVQSQDVQTQVKHFDAYNQETYRNTPADNVIASNRTLHEIYMPSFEAAIKQAHAASVMCAYSWVNGSASCNNSYLLTDVLRELWDFQGFVMSDYGALHGTSGALQGTDQEQPFNTYYGTALETDIQDGTIPVSALNTMLTRVFTEMFRFRLFSQPRTGTPSSVVTTPAHVALANRVAQAGATLLKNTGKTLPLSSSHAGTVAVIGPAADASPTYAGGGSAYVIPSGTVSPLAGIQAAAGSGTKVTYTQGLPTDTSLASIPAANLSPPYPSAGTPFGGSYTGTLTARETGTYVLALTNPCGCYTSTYLYLNGKEILDNPSTPPVHTYSAAVNLTAGAKYTISISGASSQLLWARPSDLAPGITAAAKAARSASVAVVVVSDDTESEATDRPSLNLPSAQDELISAVAAANPHTVVVVNAGAPVAMPWLNQVASVLDAWYPGQTSGTALASVLFGRTNPGGHLPVTFPASLSQVPASTPEQFPGNGTEVLYSEGVAVGYRWYDARGKTPLFPFGFGLSYTRFAYSGLRMSRSSVTGTEDVRVSATVTNIGNRTGSDVAQLYLGDPSSTGEPPRSLAGFQRVTLAPGGSARVSFVITPRDMSWWSDTANGWTQTPGLYRVYVGDSSALANLPLRNAFRVTSTPGARRVVLNAPDVAGAGKAFAVHVTLTAGGSQTLHGVALSVQVPAGWTVTPGSVVFGAVRPGRAIAATFRVTPPAYLPASTGVVHATATVGDLQREAGVTVTVRP